MPKKPLPERPSMVQRIKDILTTILHSAFITTVVRAGSASALLFLVTGEPLLVYLSVAFLIMFLIQGKAYLLTMMKTYGWQVEVEAWVDIGVLLEVMAFLLVTVVSLLVLSLSCT
jgi:hypothetical protein